jgi:hypothetical protein
MMNRSKMMKGFPPLIKGKAASTNAGFQENISREKAIGRPMKQSVKVAYKEADNGLRASPSTKMRAGRK